MTLLCEIPSLVLSLYDIMRNLVEFFIIFIFSNDISKFLTTVKLNFLSLKLHLYNYTGQHIIKKCICDEYFIILFVCIYEVIKLTKNLIGSSCKIMLLRDILRNKLKYYTERWIK